MWVARAKRHPFADWLAGRSARFSSARASAGPFTANDFRVFQTCSFYQPRVFRPKSFFRVQSFGANTRFFLVVVARISRGRKVLPFFFLESSSQRQCGSVKDTLLVTPARKFARNQKRTETREKKQKEAQPRTSTELRIYFVNETYKRKGWNC